MAHIITYIVHIILCLSQFTNFRLKHILLSAKKAILLSKKLKLQHLHQGSFLHVRRSSQLATIAAQTHENCKRGYNLGPVSISETSFRSIITRTGFSGKLRTLPIYHNARKTIFISFVPPMCLKSINGVSLFLNYALILEFSTHQKA